MATRSTTKPTKRNAAELQPAPDRAATVRAAYRFETNRLRAASSVADAVLGRLLSYGEVSGVVDEHTAYRDRVLREEASLRNPQTDLRTEAGARKARAKLEAALPEPLRETFAQYEDWLAFTGVIEAEVAYAVGLAIGRRRS